MRRKRQVCSMLMGILFCCVGCGLQQEKQDLDVSEVTTGAALCINEDYQSEGIQHQMEILVENAHKWRIAGDENRTGDEMIRYVVTDLDRNGRLEIMALRDLWEEDEVLQGFFEINASGDGIDEIRTNEVVDISLGNMLVDLDSAYYDPKTGECHYVMGNELSEDELSEDEEILFDECVAYEKNIFALTLKNGQLSSDILAYQELGENQAGKIQSRFYQLDGSEKSEIDMSSYTIEALGDAVYADCGRYSLRFSPFFFDHSLEDMTEKQIYHALEKSYRESFMGYPLGQQEKKVAGQKLRVPQYSIMQDAEKQKRINQMIVKQVEQILRQSDDEKNDSNVDISIKYAGGDKVSLLVQVSKSTQGELSEAIKFSEEMAQRDGICGTVNIDLEQGSLLSEQDLLPESEQEYVIEDIQDEIAEEYEESGKKQDSDIIYKNLLENLEKWQGISLYQTGDMIGLVIPAGLTSDSYVICQVWKGWYVAGYGGDSSVSFADIDWGAYQYRMLAPEYQDLQDYMPVLTGGAEFFDQWEEWDGDDGVVVENQNMTIRSWAEEYYEKEMPETFPVYGVCICDLTQDGKPELVLELWNGVHLILHKEGNNYYGVLEGRREFCNLQINGVYGAGKENYYLQQLHFEKDHFVEEYLGGCEYSSQTEDYKYYIKDQKVEKDVYKKWEKSIMAEDVQWYSPEAIWNEE